MKVYKSNDRLIGFRVNNDFVNYLVHAGIIPSNWDEQDPKEKKKMLSSAVQDFLSDFATDKLPEAKVTTEDVPDLLKELKSINNRLSQLEGKFPPQAA